MATEGENTSVSGADMFEAALAVPEQQTQEQPQQQAAPETPTGEQPRDEHGRFAAKVEDQPQPPAQPDQQATPQPQQQADHRVPLVELLNEREKRQQLAAERDQLRQQAEAFQRQLQALQAQNAPKPDPAPDVFENPQGFVGHIDQRFQSLDQRFRMQEVNFSLRLAHREYKQEFEQAYHAAVQARQMGDPAIDAIYNSSDPGESLMRWHRSNTLLSKTGGNLDAYLESQLQEKLKDPAFLAKAIEAARGQAQQQPNGQQAPVVDLPPSLTRTPGASAAQATPGMPSDRERFDAAFR